MKSTKSMIERDDLDQLKKEIIKNERLKLSTEIA